MLDLNTEDNPTISMDLRYLTYYCLSILVTRPARLCMTAVILAPFIFYIFLGQIFLVQKLETVSKERFH